MPKIEQYQGKCKTCNIRFSNAFESVEHKKSNLSHDVRMKVKLTRGFKIFIVVYLIAVAIMFTFSAYYQNEINTWFCSNISNDFAVCKLEEITQIGQ